MAVMGKWRSCVAYLRNFDCWWIGCNSETGNDVHSDRSHILRCMKLLFLVNLQHCHKLWSQSSPRNFSSLHPTTELRHTGSIRWACQQIVFNHVHETTNATPEWSWNPVTVLSLRLQTHKKHATSTRESKSTQRWSELQLL
jgi:hypothetical protein